MQQCTVRPKARQQVLHSVIQSGHRLVVASACALHVDALMQQLRDKTHALVAAEETINKVKWDAHFKGYANMNK